MELVIRGAREADAALMIELLNPIIRAGGYTVMDEPLTLDEQVEFIRSFPTQGAFLAAFDASPRPGCSAGEGRLLGMQDVVPLSPGSRVFGHVGVISTFIALEVRRQGVGRRLSAATFQAARELGFRKLSAAIRLDNPAALAFYQGLGFRVVGVAQRQALLRGRYVDEVLAEMWLGG
jgi:L-amino acid N-acyltransferase YncA